MHRILVRQIKQSFSENFEIPSVWKAFLEAISDTYTHLDEDRALLDRSLEISSKEFLENSRRLEEARLKVAAHAKDLAEQVAARTQDLDKRVVELEDARRAATNLLEDLEGERKALAEAKAKDDAILASIADGCIVVNEKGEIILMNQIAQKMLGISSKEAIGRPWHEILHREDENGNPISPEQGAIHAALTTTTTPAKKITEVYYYVRRDKTRFPVAITVAPVVLANKIVGAIEVFRDVTHEREVDQAKTEFVSIASHQLRTPLSTISWYTEMLLAGDVGNLNEEQKKYLDEVYRSNRRMVQLINALLNVSRLEMGTFVIEPEPTDLVKLVQSVADEQKHQIGESKIQLSISFAKDIPRVPIDQKLWRMVVQNLLSNAVKYTPEGGKVTLELTLPDAAQVLFRISDTGYGIPRNQQEKVFSKLFRADNVREKNAEGTGLGLYIVKSIIDHSGGTIWFESEENKGTTFYVTLPISGMKKKEGTRALT